MWSRWPLEVLRRSCVSCVWTLMHTSVYTHINKTNTTYLKERMVIVMFSCWVWTTRCVQVSPPNQGIENTHCDHMLIQKLTTAQLSNDHNTIVESNITLCRSSYKHHHKLVTQYTVKNMKNLCIILHCIGALHIPGSPAYCTRGISSGKVYHHAWATLSPQWFALWAVHVYVIIRNPHHALMKRWSCCLHWVQT